MSCVALSPTNCNQGKLMRITSPLTIHGLCFHQRSFVVCAPFPQKKKKKKKKKSCILPLGYFISNTDFLFFPQRLPKALRWWFCARHCYDYWKTPEQGIGGLLVNDLWFEATFFITLASQFATPYVNLFSLGSVDVIQFIEVSRYRCPGFHLVMIRPLSTCYFEFSHSVTNFGIFSHLLK